MFGFLINGFTVPGQNDTDLLSAIEAIPGALIGMGVVWYAGLRQEQAHPAH